jgi:hypothetical protein
MGIRKRKRRPALNVRKTSMEQYLMDDLNFPYRNIWH